MLPELRLKSVRRITEDKNHNAFTDLCRFRDAFFLAFRSSPSGHGISPDASVVVLKSADGRAWSEVHRFAVEGRDTRDPHFLVHNEKLFVYSGTWDATPEGITRRELNDHVGYAVTSDDGELWSEPVLLESTRGHYIWRASAYDGKAYLCGRRKHGFVSMPSVKSEWALEESVMLASDDGIIFTDAGIFQENYGDETAFVLGENGEVTALVRYRDWGQPATICRSQPPYTEWERSRLDRNVGGPMLASWGGSLIAGGRKPGNDGEAVTMLSWLDEDTLVDALELPSGGDCSYPGFVSLDSQHALVSYYSSHEGTGSPLFPASVYIAEIEME